MKYDLGFGNAVAIRQAFLENYHGEMIVFGGGTLERFDYPEKEGDPELIEITRQVIKRQTGLDYKYILLTNGATGGVVIALRSSHFRFCCTRPAPWYLRYPSMIKAAGLIHETIGNFKQGHAILMDFPSNPLGSVEDVQRFHPYSPVILDGVYHGAVYSKLSIPLPKHDVFVGSYSKLLGLNGIRVGWIATNDLFRYERMRELVTAEYCGISVPSMEILKRTLYNFDWPSFEASARNKLDDNREQFTKLENYFGTKVPEIGMFYYGNTDEKCKKIMEKANIMWTSGASLGTSDEFGRLNMGQDRDITKNAVEDFLKADTIKK